VKENAMKIVAILERAGGNAEIGTAWVETATFDSTALLEQVIDWAKRRTVGSEPTRTGRLMLDITDEDGHSGRQ
jgi:hypothetical protein